MAVATPSLDAELTGGGDHWKERIRGSGVPEFSGLAGDSRLDSVRLPSREGPRGTGIMVRPDSDPRRRPPQRCLPDAMIEAVPGTCVRVAFRHADAALAPSRWCSGREVFGFAQSINGGAMGAAIADSP